MNRLVFFHSLFNYCYVVLFLLIRRNELLFKYLLASFFICLTLLHGCFSRFFKSCKRYQIAQRTKYKEILLTLTENFSKTTLRKLLIFCQRTFLIKMYKNFLGFFYFLIKVKKSCFQMWSTIFY